MSKDRQTRDIAGGVCRIALLFARLVFFCFVCVRAQFRLIVLIVSLLQKAIVPSAKAYRLHDYRFNDFSLEDEETLKVRLRLHSNNFQEILSYRSRFFFFISVFSCSDTLLFFFFFLGLSTNVSRFGLDR